MLRLEDQVLETLLREALDGVVTKVSSRKGVAAVIYQDIYPCNQLGNELASWLIGQAGIQTGIGLQASPCFFGIANPLQHHNCLPISSKVADK